jgi:hypothetical protein
MELGSKVTALEEEIAILKGEIKTILQEVRTAVLARENPFAMGAHENLQIQSATPELASTTASPEPEAPPQVIKLTQALESEPETPVHTPFSRRDETDAARPMPLVLSSRRRWNAGSLATLVAWTQETASRMDASDLDAVLSLARYGGLIDEELEATLNKLAAPLIRQGAEPRAKGVTDYLLALRELAALVEEAETSTRASGPIRKAS